jgi:hypothetical protein
MSLAYDNACPPDHLIRGLFYPCKHRWAAVIDKQGARWHLGAIAPNLFSGNEIQDVTATCARYHASLDEFLIKAEQARLMSERNQLVVG